MNRTINWSCFVCVCVLSVAFWSSIASAEIILTTASGNGADTYLSNDSQSASYNADKPHGSDGSMQGRIYAGVRTRIPYFRFDTSSAAGADLTGATISLDELSSANRARTWNVYGLNDGSGDAWSESTTAYNNAPGILQTGTYNDGNYALDIGTNPNQLSLLGTISLTSAVPTIITTTTAGLNLDSFLAADTNGLVTFVLVAQGSDSTASYSFATKENTSSYPFPTLTLPNAVIPEPGSLITLLMAAAAIGGWWLARGNRSD